MEHRTKKVLFSALVGLGIGAIFTGLAVAYAVNIYGLLGLFGLLYGLVGTTACLVKGAFEHKSYREFMKNRELDVSKSFDPVATNENTKTDSKEIEIPVQHETKQPANIQVVERTNKEPAKISKKTKLMECLEPSEEPTLEK